MDLTCRDDPLDGQKATSTSLLLPVFARRHSALGRDMEKTSDRFAQQRAAPAWRNCCLTDPLWTSDQNHPVQHMVMLRFIFPGFRSRKVQSTCGSVLHFLTRNRITLKVRRSTSLQLDVEFYIG
ncbi:uncharacterized protein LOC143167568 [Aptenodytes patagonicus]|uniref:uncharacterized protein LOC143167568 n=1 Tax=Aptenodytes patagonicus TaxID=9234 RepID=UPI003F9F8FC1